MSYTPMYIYMSYIHDGQDSCHVITNSKHKTFCSLPTHHPALELNLSFKPDPNMIPPNMRHNV